MADDIYCIDTSSLMEMVRQYPKSRFPSLWQKIDSLVEAGRLIAPREVFKEIKQGEDSLVEWAKNKRKMFKSLDAEQAKAASTILSLCPALINPLNERPQADPFLIALAQAEGGSGPRKLFGAKYIVVTQEGRTNPNKIPQVCKRLGIECSRLLDLFEREGWEF